MKTPIGNVPAVILEFTQQVLIPAAERQGGLLPFTVGVGAGLFARQAPAMLSRHLDALKALGVVDDQNRIDADLLFEEASKNLEAHPVILPFGYKPDRADLDALRDIMNRHGE